MRAFLLVVLVNLTLFAYSQQYGFNWARNFGGSYTSLTDVKTDPAGNIFITGNLQVSADLDPGPGTVNVTANGGYDMFIVKLTANGEFVWGKSIGGADNDVVRQVELDASGNLYFAGSFSGTVDFDPGTSVHNVTSAGTTDLCFFKLDADGNFIWVKALGSTGDDLVQGMDLKNGSIYITGTFGGSMDFDPGPNTAMLTTDNGGANGYIAKYNLDGDLSWTYKINGNAALNMYDISADQNGNVYAGGHLRGIVTFGASADSVLTNPEKMAFITKLSPNGDFIWARSFFGTGAGDEESYCFAVEAKNDYVLFGGRVSGTVESNPGGTSTLLDSPGGSGYICKMNGNGEMIWAKEILYTYTIYSIITDNDDNLYYTGYYLYTTNQYACEIGKLNSSGLHLLLYQIIGSSVSVGFRVSLTPDNGLLTVGRYNYTIDFNPGPGYNQMTATGDYNGFIQKLKECVPVTGTDVQTACSSYTWIDGVTYTSSNNTATHTLVNSNGCDSVVHLDLTILANASTFVHTACESYTWINGTTYTESNFTDQYTMPNSVGCDSVITLNLTITSPNASVEDYSNGVLTASAGDSYQWIFCDNQATIPGATSQTYTPATGGNYAVIVSGANCADTSACFSVEGAGLENGGMMHFAAIQPNPSSNGIFTVTAPASAETIEYVVYATDGRKILSKRLLNSQSFEVQINEAEGIYLLEITLNNNYTSTYRLVKK